MTITQKMPTPLFPIHRIVSLFFLLLMGCSRVVQENDIDAANEILKKSLHRYEANFYFSSILGVAELKVQTDLDQKTILIIIKDPLDKTKINYLQYQNDRWSYKNETDTPEFYFISDKSFLKYLHLDKILPNSSFIVNFLKGTFPYANRTPLEGKVVMSIKGKGYIQKIHVKDHIPYLLEIFDDEQNLTAQLTYGEKSISANNFYLPSFLKIQYIKQNMTFSLSLQKFHQIN